MSRIARTRLVQALRGAKVSLRRWNRRARGFTLLELMIVTTLIAILAMIASIPIRQVRERAMMAATKQDIKQAFNAVAMYDAIYSTLPRTIADLAKVDYHESGGVVICRFTYTAARGNTPAFVRIDARHRGMRTGVQTRYPTWNGRIQEQAMANCNNVRGGSS